MVVTRTVLESPIGYVRILSWLWHVWLKSAGGSKSNLLNLQSERGTMDPQQQFCPGQACPASGQTQQANLTIHDSRKKLSACAVCGKTCSARHATPYFRQLELPRIGGHAKSSRSQ